ncbi:MAG: hypothetical protein WCL70_13055 [Paludibacter sp.]
MHRKSLFFVWFASAAITFGGLWFGLGKDHFNRGHHMCHPMMERHCMMKEMDENECMEKPDNQKNEKVIVIKQAIKNDSVKK